ncbi:MAG: NAD-dependent epimerase/dehydratase family protein [Candidatus Nitronauta litoralis]|uniref:NAD-dependent epimerase/dehydratase family protein n=1 Tax=Candidatus Nitronauta litoralis TaxID=2705533 RepID=A0A7T0BXF3_9BACT|nr:MAG: NAD-dependent epimerase/dehydratase family protein [Candidatus Nitronauta litoralis]
MNILLTGGAGFIGSHVADAYLAEGHKVVVVDNLSTGNRELVPKGAIFYPVDITSSDIYQIMGDEKIEVINHHAAQISIQESVQNPDKDANSNIIGTLQLLQNAISFKVARVVFASTGGAIYGELNSVSADESTPPAPYSPYAISKLCAEHYLDFFKNVHGLDRVILRYSNVFGPRQNPQGEAGVVAIHCHRLARGDQPIIFGDGEQTRDFIFVQDVVSANIKALDENITGVFNVGTGRETSVNELTKTLIDISGKETEIDYQPAKAGDLIRSAINPKRFNNLGWSSEHSLKDGLLETYRYFENS